MVNDYSLMIKCKDGDQKAQLALFHRYHNYLLKKYNALKKKRSSIFFDNFEDFESEAFVYFLAAVDYTDLSRLDEPNKWKFLTPYMWFIGNMITKFLDQDPETLSLNEPVKFNGKTDGTEYVDYIKFNDEEDPIPRRVLEEMGCEAFVNTLGVEEKLIMKRMLEKNDEGKTPTLLELAQKFGISRPWMAVKIKNLREKYRSFVPDWI
jgi:hypothetical protein